ncbi:YceI family protein [Paucibacter sp. APW11]|uniref:YceI family protein n=1 Tax=Roseateles aquae TaxID=3077235 RepID=A0ABU3PGW7_9BURK|nr:YceI family protein [Paucibacter sp. APW11]MDT9001836.1 YceI family protein [Paucibacter sp. APW11]
MSLGRRGWLTAALGLSLGLTACQSTAPPAAPQPVASEALLAPAGGRLWRVDPAASRLRMLAFRAGTAARLGHNHVLTAPEFEGWLQLPGSGLAGASFALSFPLARLRLDDPAERARLGEAFASTLTPEDVAATRANMLGPRLLDAARHPLLQLHSLQIVGEGEQLAALVQISWHGQQHQQWLAMQARQSGSEPAAPWQVRGQLVLLQSDFGITPFSVLGGLLAMQDAVTVEFEIQLKSADRPLGRSA